ncbi:hypothetical protein EHSB41UT_04815 [Parendozoicomonas haliclonae]|uniref:Uncharacterized protein n=1 Tax=Parendozoicomonas haliclonae TaxID=1960125 RepID=A0A1X7ASA5_9GAMM|nr:hypothetical protein EHSB41UT_04815 [Parendozoicomonas haliclonae]
MEGGLDSICPAIKLFCDDIAIIINNIDVISGTAHHHIGPEATVENIVASPTVKRIVAAPAIQDVVAEPTRLLSISYAVFCLKKKTRSRSLRQCNTR